MSMYYVGERVRVRRRVETIIRGIAGMEGIVEGFTVPSITGVKVMSTTADDFALKVFFPHNQTAHWFPSTHLEFIGSNASHGAAIIKTSENDRTMLWNRFRHFLRKVGRVQAQRREYR